MEIKKVGVLGCGLMGSGIAQTAASAGFETIVREVSDELINKGFSGIEKSLAKFAEKGAITAEQLKATRDRLSGTTSFDDLADCDIIIEAIIENIEQKRTTYEQLDRICKPETIFASNTSSISITEMMTATSPARQQRFIGLHFFNPVPLMKLVEVVRTILTDEQVYEQGIEFGKKLGKVPVRAGDRTGFIVNRLLVPYMLDAIRALEEGVDAAREVGHEARRRGDLDARRSLCAGAGHRADERLQVQRVRQPRRRRAVRAARGEPDDRLPRGVALPLARLRRVLRDGVRGPSARAGRHGPDQRQGDDPLRAHRRRGPGRHRHCRS